MLSQLLRDAREKKFAVGHFNVSNLEMLRAVCEAAKEVRPRAVMIGTSEGEREFIGLKQAVALVKAFEEEYGVPLYLNADHSKSVESCKAAIDAGYPSVHFDGSGLPYEENMARTKEVVEYVRANLREVEPVGDAFVSPTPLAPQVMSPAGDDLRKDGERNSFSISVEGELGYLGGGSTITQEKVTVTPEQMTDPEQARDYVGQTGVDRLAIAIGNVHGLNLEEPQLDLERLKAIREAVPETCALVLHAGSGISDEDIKKAISLGIVNIHISTELRKAWREALSEALRRKPDEYAAYKLAKSTIEMVKGVVRTKLLIFGSTKNA